MTNPAPPHVRLALLDFFDARARPLPWRDTDDPYAIWVSEIMLQQTRVETVIPYWNRWMELFPDVHTLAAADEDEVLKAWEGLGYYSRARNLRKGAGVVRERFGGQLPRDPGVLREVPGIGPYTAGAVASIAFGVATPAVDGNVRRVLARLYDEPKPTAAWLRDRAAELVDPERPGDFNQALMELGATVCTPTSPNCMGCPVVTMCAARSAGTQEDRPAPKKRSPVPHRVITVVAACRATPEGWSVLMRRRPTDGLLGGMWEFPEWEHDVDPPGAVTLAEVEHVFSHFRATYRPFVVTIAGSEDPHGPSATWVAIEDVDALALPVAQQKIAGQVEEWVAAKDDAS